MFLVHAFSKFGEGRPYYMLFFTNLLFISVENSNTGDLLSKPKNKDILIFFCYLLNVPPLIRTLSLKKECAMCL